ncbi:Cytochrome P450 1A2 [Araneus ventricosus]|uniref:Cytochrome P450 1A2 n=1 Tax=Araneus ventricosus TaxID=182803 RepID=A0A4Y2TI91_ARAVE|nr:Cytochrome P450 1A2 [Araneus ventricosus]
MQNLEQKFFVLLIHWRECSITVGRQKDYVLVGSQANPRTFVRNAPLASASEDISVQGYIIPKDTEIIANMWAIHHDPDYWEKPEVFRPERFLSADGTQLVKPTTNYVPFSVGRRNRPGETIVLMEILHYFAETVKNFEISTPPGVKPEFEIVNGLIVRLVPQALCFRERRN